MVIKRKIEAAQAGSTLLVDWEGANVTPEQVRFLMAGFPAHRVRFIGHPATLPHPLPGTEAARPPEATTGEEPPNQDQPGQ